jgi:hypothetical protein
VQAGHETNVLAPRESREHQRTLLHHSSMAQGSEEPPSISVVCEGGRLCSISHRMAGRGADALRTRSDLPINIRKASSIEETAPKREHVRSCIVVGHRSRLCQLSETCSRQVQLGSGLVSLCGSQIQHTAVTSQIQSSLISDPAEPSLVPAELPLPPCLQCEYRTQYFWLRKTHLRRD